MKYDYDRDGFDIARNLIDSKTVKSWAALYASLGDPARVPEWNPVAVNDERLQPLLILIASYSPLLDAACELLGPDLALYNQRFVVKDAAARGEVFMHQDTGYHVGHMGKMSAFVALSEMAAGNGGMYLMAHSHEYGYLGDAGEIRWPPSINEQVPTFYSPTLNPGDVLFMNSATWHGSDTHTGGPDRILADIIYTPASDPGARCLMRGKWLTEYRWTDEMRAGIFQRSRVSRIRELEAEVAALKAGQA